MKKFLMFFLTAFFLVESAKAGCPDCQDQVCVGPVCACVPNVSRCPPPPPPPVKIVRHSFCNITQTGPNQLSDCQNCSSNFDGDAGKADCLARHQGHYVNYGECKPAECRTIAALPSQPIFAYRKVAPKEGALAPILMQANAAQLEKLEVAEKGIASAQATVMKLDGSRFSCSYEMTWRGVPKIGIQFSPRNETCVAMK